MLFRKKIQRACVYCTHGTAVDDGKILCTKCGMVDAESECRRFCYDPCKRIPPRQKALDFSQYDHADFSL